MITTEQAITIIKRCLMALIGLSEPELKLIRSENSLKQFLNYEQVEVLRDMIALDQNLGVKSVNHKIDKRLLPFNGNSTIGNVAGLISQNSVPISQD